MQGLGSLSVEGARELRRDLKRTLTSFANGRGSIKGLLHEIERIAMRERTRSGLIVFAVETVARQ